MKFATKFNSRLNSTAAHRGASVLAASAFCLFVGFSFTGTAKADCGLSMAPRAIANFPDAGSLTLQAEPTAHATTESSKAGPEDSPFAASIVGLWLTTFTSGGQIVDQGFDIWTSDGTEILNDTPPPATGNVCLGTYVQTGPNTFVLKHPSWTFDNNGNLNGTAIIRETVTVQPSAKTFKGTYTIDFLTLSGANVGHYTGTVAATRITVTSNP